MHRFMNNKKQEIRTRPFPWAWFFSIVNLFYVLNHNNMTLKPFIWWKIWIFSMKNKNNYCMSLSFSSVQWDRMFTERSLNNARNQDFSELFVSIQWTFRKYQLTESIIFILWNVSDSVIASTAMVAVIKGI